MIHREFRNAEIGQQDPAVAGLTFSTGCYSTRLRADEAVGRLDRLTHGVGAALDDGGQVLVSLQMRDRSRAAGAFTSVAIMSTR